MNMVALWIYYPYALYVEALTYIFLYSTLPCENIYFDLYKKYHTTQFFIWIMWYQFTVYFFISLTTVSAWGVLGNISLTLVWTILYPFDSKTLRSVTKVLGLHETYIISGALNLIT